MLRLARGRPRLARSGPASDSAGRDASRTRVVQLSSLRHSAETLEFAHCDSDVTALMALQSRPPPASGAPSAARPLHAVCGSRPERRGGTGIRQRVRRPKYFCPSCPKRLTGRRLWGTWTPGPTQRTLSDPPRAQPCGQGTACRADCSSCGLLDSRWVGGGFFPIRSKGPDRFMLVLRATPRN